MLVHNCAAAAAGVRPQGNRVDLSGDFINYFYQRQKTRHVVVGQTHLAAMQQ